jgi:hypothetical protein
MCMSTVGCPPGWCSQTPLHGTPFRHALYGPHKCLENLGDVSPDFCAECAPILYSAHQTSYECSDTCRPLPLVPPNTPPPKRHRTGHKNMLHGSIAARLKHDGWMGDDGDHDGRRAFSAGCDIPVAKQVAQSHPMCAAGGRPGQPAACLEAIG